MAITKNPTAWYNPGTFNNVITVGMCFLVDQSGNFLRDQAGNFLVTTPNYVIGKNPTIWTPTGAS